MGSAIIHSQKPNVKALLVRVAVNESLAEGNLLDAVRMLDYAKAAELPLPDYGEQFVSAQYDKALEKNDPTKAWMIAGEMVRNRANMVKPDTSSSTAESQRQAEWVEREKEAFVLHAESILNKVEQFPDDQRSRQLKGIELRRLFEEFMLREDDGFRSEHPSELSQRVAHALIEFELEEGSKRAFYYAKDARMPRKYIAEVRRQVAPTIMDRARKLLQKV